MAVAGRAKYQARLKSFYFDSVAAELKNELKLNNLNQAPRLEKIVVSVGLGRAKDEKKLLEVGANTLRKITGQQPLETLAKQSIASFKLREGSKIGLKVTLRGERMYEFADRFINIVLPRMRDFHGVNPKAFDQSGNYSVGLTDQSVFAELSYEDTATPHGVQVTFVIKNRQPSDSRALLEKLGMPFAKTTTNKEKK